MENRVEKIAIGSEERFKEYILIVTRDYLDYILNPNEPYY